MSIRSMCPNRCDLYEMIPAKDSSGGSAPVATLITAGIRCSVQLNGASARPFYDSVQFRMVVPAEVFFPGEALGVEVVNGALLKHYRLTWTDGGGLLLRIKGYAEATLGRFKVWKASCEQVK